MPSSDHIGNKTYLKDSIRIQYCIQPLFRRMIHFQARDTFLEVVKLPLGQKDSQLPQTLHLTQLHGVILFNQFLHLLQIAECEVHNLARRFDTMSLCKIHILLSGIRSHLSTIAPSRT